MNTAILTKTNHSAIISIMFNFRRITMGISLGGMFKSFLNPTNLAMLAMGPGGWAAMAMKTIGSQIAMGLIEQLGQKLGLPPAVIDLAQAAFGAATGQPGLAQQNIKEAVQGFAGQFNLRPSEAGQLERELMGASNKSFKNMSNIADKVLEQFQKDAVEGKNNGDENSVSGAGGKKGESFLVAFAKALGKLMDGKMNKMMAISKEIDQKTTANNDANAKAAEDGGAQKQAVTSELSAEMQALGQELNILSQALANSLKTMGEANATLARKG
jgi:hypothetical protein